jgi:tripartite-type tricarboxylate transporter receptor subunit TctC
MLPITLHAARLAFVGSIALVTIGPCGAQDFYAGKSIQLVIGFDVGGGYDLYARTVARHWTRHIRVTQPLCRRNMPGAGTRIAANWLYSVAPKDGTAVGTVVQSTAVDQALGEPGIRFDAAQFNWLGNPIVDNLVTLSWSASGLATLDDVENQRRAVLWQHRRRADDGVSARDQPAHWNADQGV